MTANSLAHKLKDELRRVEQSEIKTGLSEWLAADDEFNHWFLVTTKRQLDDDELMNLLEGYRETQEIVETAWHSFDKFSRDEASVAILLARMEQSAERMRELMNK